MPGHQEHGERRAAPTLGSAGAAVLGAGAVSLLGQERAMPPGPTLARAATSRPPSLEGPRTIRGRAIRDRPPRGPISALGRRPGSDRRPGQGASPGIGQASECRCRAPRSGPREGRSRLPADGKRLPPGQFEQVIGHERARRRRRAAKRDPTCRLPGGPRSRHPSPARATAVAWIGWSGRARFRSCRGAGGPRSARR